MNYVTLSTYDKETTFSDKISIPDSVFPSFTIRSPVSTYNMAPNGSHTYDTISETYARSCGCQTVLSRGPVNLFINPVLPTQKKI